MSESAQAIPINGSIGFNGSGSGTTSGGTSTLTFNNPLMTDMRTNDYLTAGVTAGTFVNFAPISWTGSGDGAMLIPGPQLEWSFTQAGTTFTFTLTSLQNASLGNDGVSLRGRGILTMSGAFNRDPTTGSFSVQGTGTNFTFTIVQASNTGIGPVPEGGSAIALLGIGVIGLEVLRRKFRTA
jgi:hypothetical protein